MQIAPSAEAAQWRALQLDDAASPDWAVAVRILEARIKERFIDPVDHLIDADQARPPAQRRFGFAILAIDCLLVETLGAFVEGLTDTDGRSRRTFCDFLTTRPLLAKAFSARDLAERFYEDFRCGILHQAEIGGDSLVWSVGPVLQADGGRIIVNRTRLHQILTAEFRSYLAELGDPAQAPLRSNFRRKMDFISRA